MVNIIFCIAGGSNNFSKNLWRAFCWVHLFKKILNTEHCSTRDVDIALPPFFSPKVIIHTLLCVMHGDHAHSVLVWFEFLFLPEIQNGNFYMESSIFINLWFNFWTWTIRDFWCKFTNLGFYEKPKLEPKKHSIYCCLLCYHSLIIGISLI